MKWIVTCVVAVLAAAGVAGCKQPEPLHISPVVEDKIAKPALVNPIPVTIGNEVVNIHKSMTATDAAAWLGGDLTSRGAVAHKVVWTARTESDRIRMIEFVFAPDGFLDSAKWVFKEKFNEETGPEQNSVLDWLEKKTGISPSENIWFIKEIGEEHYTYELADFTVDVGADMDSSWILITRRVPDGSN